MSAEDRVGPAELVDDDSENSTPNNSEVSLIKLILLNCVSDVFVRC